MKKLRSEKPQNTEVFKSILDDSMRSRVRARNLNAIEEDRLQKMNKIIEKERRHREHVRSRVLQRTEKTFKEKNALQKVLSKDYRVDNFMTMQRGFKRPLYQPPREARRFKVETRIYHSGFGVRALRPEINREMRQVDPDTVHKILQKVLAEKCLEVNDVPVERTLPDSEMYQKLFDRAMQTDRTIRKRNEVLYHSLRDVTPSPRTNRSAIFKTSDYAQTPVRLKSGNYTESPNYLQDIPEISVRPKPEPEPDYESSIQEVSVSQQFNKDNVKNGDKTKVSVRPVSHAEGNIDNSVTQVSIRPLDGMNSPNKNFPSYKFNQTHGDTNGGHSSLKLPSIPKSTSVNSIHKIVEEADGNTFSDEDDVMDIKNNPGSMSNMYNNDNRQNDDQTTVNDNKLQFISELLDDDGRSQGDRNGGNYDNGRSSENDGYGENYENYGRSSQNDRDGGKYDNPEQKYKPVDRTKNEQPFRSTSNADEWQFKTADSDDNDSQMYES